MGKKNKDQRCPYCLSNDLRPKGWIRRNGRRRYKCKSCEKQISLTGKNWFVSDMEIGIIDGLLLERLSFRGICRSMKISLSWLMLYYKRLYKEQPDDLNYRPGKAAEVELKLIDTELYEVAKITHQCDETAAALHGMSHLMVQEKYIMEDLIRISLLLSYLGLIKKWVLPF